MIKRPCHTYTATPPNFHSAKYHSMTATFRVNLTIRKHARKHTMRMTSPANAWSGMGKQEIDITKMSAEEKLNLLERLQKESKNAKIERREAYEGLRAEFVADVRKRTLSVIDEVKGFHVCGSGYKIIFRLQVITVICFVYLLNII